MDEGDLALDEFQQFRGFHGLGCRVQGLGLRVFRGARFSPSTATLTHGPLKYIHQCPKYILLS